MDHLDYGLSEPKLVIMGDGNVFVAGQIQAQMDPPAIPQSQSMRMSAFTQTVGSTTITNGSTALGTITVNPPKLTLTFPKPWPKPDDSYNFSGGTTTNAENIRMKIIDETNTEIWNDFLSDQGSTKLNADSSGVFSVDQIFGNTTKTFRFYVIPEIKIDLGNGSSVNAKVMQGNLTSGLATDFAPFLIKTQQGGPNLVARPISLDLSSLSAADRRAASGSLNMLWVYKRAMQFMATIPGLSKDQFNNFQFWWNPGVGNDGISRFDEKSGNRMYVRGDRSDNADDFDDGVLLHEIGHLVHHVYGPARGFQIFHTPAGVAEISSNHNGDLGTDPGLAWIEGWADFFQAAVRTSPFYPEDHRATVLLDSGASGRATSPKIDPAGSASNGANQTDGWNNEWRVAKVLWKAFKDPGVASGALGALTAALPPSGDQVDGLRAFLDRLGFAAAVNPILSAEGLLAPVTPAVSASVLSLDGPSAPFNLVMQTPIPNAPAGTVYVPKEGSAFFQCNVAGSATGYLIFRLQGLGDASTGDIDQIGLIVTSEVDSIGYPVPSPGLSWAPVAGSPGSYQTTVAASGSRTLLSFYNRSLARSFTNLVITVSAGASPL